ncbi:2-oxo-4-hydroxy-4-carboxy-5-ureidoimidazoline decarboxylase [Nitrospirillum amazonense]|uniref:2-oxo-4-hydroxy-4-carboxy-5-ureidoimidazoline decarboxylase n=1 Tax=Nitrospirillum amazonense TaxID=28077 RepID=A0A560JCQ1_9PROT|nr:2-oxo-4-hydroxy-4-carboxy-5-ureidoimidazoline decarboxylase [Nitrospirillum amazonense]MDG3440001.1 2-oxo-4-hydroxy-4-carboxy-5-ureidoimidazoline decarboxylase [Nitrospirillum amazonense]TWB68816.1 OHCU decarboxylase [Nitrospirillum amazonense]
MSDFFDSREAFVARFGGVFEHSPWIAEAAWDAGLPADGRTAQGLHAALVTQFRAAGRERRLGVLLAHPDLAGRLAVRGELTADSTAEQASAGLDKCTPEEYARFQELNDAYKARFGFPFILAVRGLTRAAILKNFEARVGNDTDTEFATATAQVERIALLRLKEMLP